MNPPTALPRPEILVCPFCRAGGLDWPSGEPAGCSGCGATFQLHDGWPQFLRPEWLSSAEGEWVGATAAYGAARPGCGFPLIDGPLIESCQGNVLELGCGNGRLMQLVRDRCATLVGIDPAPSMTAAARRAGFTALTAAAEELPFADGSFDTLLSGWASMRYTDQSRSFPEAARVLRPGGTFTFTLWNFHIMRLNGRIGFWRRGRLAPRDFLGHFRERDVSSISGLVRKLDSAGLELEAIRSTIFPSFLARKLQTVFRYYRGRLGARLGYNIIFSCHRKQPSAGVQ